MAVMGVSENGLFCQVNYDEPWIKKGFSLHFSGTKAILILARSLVPCPRQYLGSGFAGWAAERNGFAGLVLGLCCGQNVSETLGLHRLATHLTWFN